MDLVDPKEEQPSAVWGLSSDLHSSNGGFILHIILAKRLNAVEHYAFQAGFVEGRGASENIWLMNTILKSARTNETSAYVSLLDFKKAFDSVSHNALIGILSDLGLPPRLVVYIRILTPD